jgi:hypothetical protein
MVFGMEDLVANAFIGLLEKSKGAERKIAVRRLAKYKNNVLSALNKGDRTAVIPTSRDYTAKFLYRFGDYFSYEENENADDYICLDKTKTLGDLRRKFSVYISDNTVRDCFSDEKNLEPILSVAE